MGNNVFWKDVNEVRKRIEAVKAEVQDINGVTLVIERRNNRIF